MKHMVINTHNAESCAFRGEEEGSAMSGALDALGKAVADQGGAMDGFWINRSAHTFFMLIDAPNAHVIDEALLAAGLVGRTHTEMYPVMDAEEVRRAFEASH